MHSFISLFLICCLCIVIKWLCLLSEWKNKLHAHINLAYLPCASLMSVVGQCLIVAFRPLPTEWHRLRRLIELGWRSDSNVQQMAATWLHFEWRRVATLPHAVLPGVMWTRQRDALAEERVLRRRTATAHFHTNAQRLFLAPAALHWGRCSRANCTLRAAHIETSINRHPETSVTFSHRVKPASTTHAMQIMAVGSPPADGAITGWQCCAAVSARPRPAWWTRFHWRPDKDTNHWS